MPTRLFEGRHNVDIFVAPKYIKKTKHDEKVAVTMSRHQKELAEYYDRKTTPRGTGEALQDALFEYFRDEMQLEGVQRGSVKLVAGRDQRTAEERNRAELKAREERLKEQEEALERKKAIAEARARELGLQVEEIEWQESGLKHRLAVISEKEHQLEALLKGAETDRTAAQAELSKASEARAEAQRVQSEVEALREKQAEADRKRHAAELQQAQLLRSAAEANREAITVRDAADKTRKQLVEELATAQRERKDAAEALAAAEVNRRDAVQERAEADHLRREAEEDRRRGRDRLCREQAQLALLERASDDGEGLNLRTKGGLFEMDKEKMTSNEREAYGSPWSKTLVAMARTFAVILERLREAARKLRTREEVADKRMAEAERRERDAMQRAQQSLAHDR
ncbi:MAG TPA: hypothetical protein VNR60_09190, partial [Croceibacterium sp.]|nr:hypothetical protein [Croceibacterium sp.]